MSDYSDPEGEFDDMYGEATYDNADEPVYGTIDDPEAAPAPLGEKREAKAAEYSGPDFSPDEFHGAFWSTATESGLSLDQGVTDLLEVLTQGNDFCKDLVDLYKERASVEEQYAKGLNKVRAKASKLGENTYGSLSVALERQLQEFDERAAWHTSHAEMLRKRMTKPTLEFAEAQKKQFKAHTKPLEKQLKALTDVESEVAKCQKFLNAKSKDLEAAAEHVAAARRGVDGKPPATEKEIAKLSKATAKANVSKGKAVKRFQDALVKLRGAREDWETITIREFKELQKMEDKRIGYLKTLFTDLANTYHRLLPEMSKTFGECVSTADSIKGSDTIAAICKERGTGPFLAVKRLYTCWEEDYDVTMDRERRVQELAVAFRLAKDELRKSQATRAGLQKLYDASREIQHERQSEMQAVLNVKRQLESHDFVLAADYANTHKLRYKLCSSLRKDSPSHSLQGYIRELTTRKPPIAVLQLPPHFSLQWREMAAEEEQHAALDAELLGVLQGGAKIPAPAPAGGPPAPPVNRAPPAAGAPPPPPPMNAPAPGGGGAPPPPPPGAPPFAAGGGAPPPPPPGGRPFAAGGGPPPPPPPGGPPSFAGLSGSSQTDSHDAGGYEEEYEEGHEEYPDEEGGEVLFRVRATYDYEKADEDELDLAAGEELDVYDHSDETWWQAGKGGVFGMIPSSYVEVIE